MSIKIDIATFGGKSDHIIVEYGEERRLDLRIASGGITLDAPLSISEARELAAALYGLAHLA